MGAWAPLPGTSLGAFPRTRLGRSVLLLLALLGLLWPTRPAAALQAELVASGLDSPVFVTAPPGDSRLFVVERPGRIQIVENGAVLGTPFLDITSQVRVDDSFGCFGLAFAPDFESSGLFYVYYVNLAGESTISRFAVSTSDPNQAEAGEEVVFSLLQPFSDHNGGTIAFSPVDGYLYFAPGDGGGGPYDPFDRSQDPQLLLGKMLRIDVEGTGSGYAIPPDNPFVGAPPRDEIWSFGLRNPFKFSFDRATGELWIGDVGQETLDEIDRESPGDGGRNYGWDIMEGTLCNPFDPSPLLPCPDPAFTLPFYEYDQTQGDCSVTGGYVSRGFAPEIAGLYVFGDFCSGRIWSLDPDDVTDFVNWTAQVQPPSGPGAFDLVSFGEGGYGELYAVYLSGDVYRIRSSEPDADDDFAPDSVDNCPGSPNPDQADADGDGTGDACDDPCDDGVDNDGDGLVDFVDADGDGRSEPPGDPGCFGFGGATESPDCQDGEDNDGDGRVDFDGGESIHGACAAGSCPPGVSDIDADGQADPDLHCVNRAYRNSERMRVGCGLSGAPGLLLLPLLGAACRRRGSSR